MNVSKLVRKVGKLTLSKLGWTLHRLPDQGVDNNINFSSQFEDPLAALLLKQSGKSVAFSCPTELCRVESGFSHAPNDWHPFVSTLLQYEKNRNLQYEDSILKQFYDLWQPANAAEAIAGFRKAPKSFYFFPPYCVLLTPWTSWTPRSLMERREKWIKGDFREHGQPDCNWKIHRSNRFGPLEFERGFKEFSRLVNIYDQLKKNGYDRKKGCIGVTILRVGTNYRFLVAGGGHHRAAAMAALRKKSFPAQFKVDYYLADIKDVIHWPQVRSGLWSKHEAIAYVEHLFNFDSRSWAQSNGFYQEFYRDLHVKKNKIRKKPVSTIKSQFNQVHNLEK